MPDQNRVRKRIPNACTRCRKSKIKCSGSNPCEHCKKRGATCIFDDREQRILISQSYVARLERQVSRLTRHEDDRHRSFEQSEDRDVPQQDEDGLTDEHLSSRPSLGSTPQPNDLRESNANGSAAGVAAQSRQSAAADDCLSNPLHPSDLNSYIVDHTSKPVFLGVTSNWAFGRRILDMAHQRVNGTKLTPTSLLFQGSTYDLGWDGQRTSTAPDLAIIPTSDFALFLINAVKFHCARLFHMLEEPVFMHHFGQFYDENEDRQRWPTLWYIHFLLILAFGKAFIVHEGKGKRPPGAEFFVQAMQLMPDITALYADPIQSVEILCCAALYFQCLDARSAAYNVIGQAKSMALEQGMHTDAKSQHLSDNMLERRYKAWWTVYILDRQMTSLLGVPMSLSDDDITTPLPSFAGSAKKTKALSLHIKLCKATAVILSTIYWRGSRKRERLLTSMREALRIVAGANDEREQAFPLRLSEPASGIDRLSAYLHLFHHQSLNLATRPLLFSFWQKRLESPVPLHVSSSHGARSLLRVCVGSAQQSLAILEALQSQSLLESFVSFDREAAFSSAVVLLVASAVDPSLMRKKALRMENVYKILDEMVARGNLVAEFQRRELEQLAADISKLTSLENDASAENAHQLTSLSQLPHEALNHPAGELPEVNTSPDVNSLLGEWNSEDGLSGEHLMAVADSLDFSSFDWLLTADFESSIAVG